MHLPRPDELANFASDPARLRSYLLALEGTAINESLVREVDGYLDVLHPGKRRVATVLIDRTPSPDEFVVILGNYNVGFDSLIVNNPAKRHLFEYENLQGMFDVVEHHPCWEGIGGIFIINRDDRPDRLYSCLRELARMGAPLDAVTRLSARIHKEHSDAFLNSTIGCLQSHLAAVRAARVNPRGHVLILEDDFGFTDDIRSNQMALKTFVERQYGFDVCLLATSRFGEILPKDDLVCLPRQPVTNAGGYLVSQEGLKKLEPCFDSALSDLLRTGDHLRFAADRCWAVLQGERFFTFKRRLGFQLPSFSDIEGRMVSYFD